MTREEIDKDTLASIDRGMSEEGSINRGSFAKYVKREEIREGYVDTSSGGITTKRRQIRNRLTAIMSECYSQELSACPIHPIFQPQKFLNKMFSYLDSVGVVIKVDRELPKLISLTGEATIAEKSSYLLGVDDCKEQFVKAGYVAVEPLIKEE